MWLVSHVHTVYSLLDGLVKPEKLAKKLKTLGYSHCCITDHGNIIGAINFSEQMRKEGIIPILGCEFYCFENDDDKTHHMVVLAKNLNGWKKLLKLTTIANKQFYYKPRIKLSQIAEISEGDLMVFSGHLGSLVGDALDKKAETLKLKQMFGDDFYLEVQAFFDGNNADKIREISKETGVRAIASADIHYLEKKDADIHRIAICSNLKLTLPIVKKKLSNGEDVPMSTFFKQDSFYLPSMEELKSFGHTDEEIDCSDILSKIEDYTILKNPIAPKFDIPPQFKNEAEYLKQLCRDGWKRRFKDTWNIQEYKDRVLKELEVIEEFNLSGYLLVVWDYIQYAKKKGVLVGPARGSAGGSLVAYLIGIIEVDPIPNGLIFERFINVSRFYSSHVNFKEFSYLENYKKTDRTHKDFPFIQERLDEIQNNKFYIEELEIITTKTKFGIEYYNHIINNVKLENNDNNSYIMWACGKTDVLDKSKKTNIIPERYSLPDIDTDFPPFFRDKVVDYVGEKHGKNKVSQILTLGSLKGRSAFKEVCRITESCDFETATLISKCLPEEGKVADEMAEYDEESIIMYTLKHMPKALKDYVSLIDGELVGEYAESFRQAIELEGCYKSLGKHAAGIVISPTELTDYCPLVKVGDVLVAGFDMKGVELAGLIKFDILGVSSLEKLMGINELLRFGKFVDDRESYYV